MDEKEINETLDALEFACLFMDSSEDIDDNKKKMIKIYADLLTLKESMEDK